jgi:hypothetical protein
MFMTRKRKKELDKMHWKDRYEYEARREAESLQGLNEKTLVERIRRNTPDPYFATWRAIGRKGTIEGSALELLDFLQRNPGKHRMLHRYHCAEVLFRILGIPDPASDNEMRKRVQWDHNGEEARQEALLELKAVIETKLASDRPE